MAGLRFTDLQSRPVEFLDLKMSHRCWFQAKEVVRIHNDWWTIQARDRACVPSWRSTACDARAAWSASAD